MADIVFVAVVVGFFAVASAYVTLCDRIVGDVGRADRRATGPGSGPGASAGDTASRPGRAPQPVPAGGQGGAA